jgi:hypothetical protein
MADDSRPAHDRPFVPADFTPPEPPRTSSFWLEPLGPQHNRADYQAWTSSIDHILATPGFEGSDWPHPMSLEENLGDLQMHADHFDRRVGFTYTVRSAEDDDVIGCIYLYPSKDAAMDVSARSWVRASHAHLDTELWSTVSHWLATAWPFRAGHIAYASRDEH